MTAKLISGTEVHSSKNRWSLGPALQIALGLVVGIVLGLVLNRYPQVRSATISEFLQPAGDIFIRLIKMTVIPVTFTSMVVGIAEVGDAKSVGRIGIKTLLYFEIVTTGAILIGLIFANLFKPGVGSGISELLHTDISALPPLDGHAETHQGFMAIVLEIIPENLFASIVKGDLLPVVFFSVLFGLALQTVSRESRVPVVAFLKGTSDAMFKVVSMVMRYAPIGVASLIAITVATFGFRSLLPLVKLVCVTYLALLVFGLLFLGATARMFGFNIFVLLRLIKEELLIAFSTCSSVSVLPQLMKRLEDFGVPESIASFVVPTGYTFNLDGASIYLAIGTMFIAQLYGVHLGAREQIVLILTMVVTSKGAAGVPGFMFVILLATLTSAHLPIEGLALIAGVDRLMDMGRTAINVLGNALAPLVIARWEGQYDADKGRAYLASYTRSDTT